MLKIDSYRDAKPLVGQHLQVTSLSTSVRKERAKQIRKDKFLGRMWEKLLDALSLPLQLLVTQLLSCTGVISDTVVTVHQRGQLGPVAAMPLLLLFAAVVHNTLLSQ